MWNRIYLLVLALCSASMAALTYYSWSWLKSIGAPLAAVEGYLYHSGHTWTFLWISSVVLLILANVVLAKSRRSWAMWTTFVYFGVFVIVRFFVVDRLALEYFRDNDFAAMIGPFPPLGPIFAVLLCTLAAAVVFANQFAVVRLSEKMYPSNVERESEVDQEEEAETTK